MRSHVRGELASPTGPEMTYAASAGSPFASASTLTMAWRTSGCRLSTAATSSGSTRFPRILT